MGPVWAGTMDTKRTGAMVGVVGGGLPETKAAAAERLSDGAKKTGTTAGVVGGGLSETEVAAAERLSDGAMQTGWPVPLSYRSSTAWT